MSWRLSSASHVLVTGAAGAIGGALARLLAARAPAARLTLVDKDARGAGGVALEIGARARALAWDLAYPDELPAAYEAATAADGDVDVLINCAGIMELRTFAGTPWSLGSRLLAVDFASPMRLMSLALPAMRARRAGLVVNLASLAGVVPIRGAGFYGAAKAGLAAASEIARIELARDGVHVVTVYPGPVSSGLERHARAQVPATLLARWLPVGVAEPLAERIIRAAEARRPRVVYPPLYQVAARALAVTRLVTERLSPEPFE